MTKSTNETILGNLDFRNFPQMIKITGFVMKKRSKATKRGDFSSQNSAAIWRRQWIPVASHCYFLPSVAKASVQVEIKRIVFTALK